MIKKNKKIMVHAYKRNNWLYRVWEFPTVVDVNKHYVCLSLHQSKIIIHDKEKNRSFHSRNNKMAFWFFFYDEWFNIIATFNDTFVQYYVNIASPFIYEEEAIKYYDFDLDVKFKSNDEKKFKILDLNEYEENSELYNYEENLKIKINETIELFKNNDFRKEIISKIGLALIKKLITIISNINIENKKSV